MHAQMGMKIEEWENGQVNIGIAVCPTKPTAIAAELANTKEGRMLMACAPSGDFIIVPDSAFIIQPPEYSSATQSQGGIKVTYAHQLRGPSNFIIMLNPQDQGYQETINRSPQPNLATNPDIIVSEVMQETEESQAEIMEDSSEKLGSHSKASPELQTCGDSDTIGSEEKAGESETAAADGAGKENLNSPQSAESGASSRAESNNGEATGSSGKEGFSSAAERRSGEMKRVSWVEDTENSDGKIGSGNSFKEGKSGSVRKSNGLRSSGNNKCNIPTGRKKNGFSSEDVVSGSTAEEGKRSGDKSRIPLITASPGDYPPSCEFYRRQMLRECMSYNPTTMADNWYGYGASLQKYAGQKVVKKIAAEQKRLEEDISSRRKTEIWILGNDSEDLMMSPITVPLRKKTMRLKPMQFVQ